MSERDLSTQTKCEELLRYIGDLYRYAFTTRKLLYCDYFGINDNSRIIIELKETTGDLLKSIPQILNYYNKFLQLKWSKTPNIPMRLIIYFRQRILMYSEEIERTNRQKFLNYAILYERYIKNNNHPKIEFFYNDTINIYKFDNCKLLKINEL